MNRTLKAFLIALALIVVGAVLAGGSLFVITETQDSFVEDKRLITTQETITEDFFNIEIDVLEANVTFFPSPDGTCYYKVETHSDILCTATVENGTLYIRQEDTRKWYQRIGLGWMNNSLEVYLPKETYAQLTVNGDTSDITVSKGLTFANASILTSTGSINWYAEVHEQLNLTCSTGWVVVNGTNGKGLRTPQTLTVLTSTGMVSLQNVTAQNISVTTSTGGCLLRNTRAQQKLYLSSSTGDHELVDVTCGSLELRSTTGDNELTNVVVAGDAKMESDTGDWELEGFDAANITITTDTGDVEGTLLSEKLFFTDTHTGDVEVPRTTSGGRCEITTDTGDIEIEIAP